MVVVMMRMILLMMVVVVVVPLAAVVVIKTQGVVLSLQDQQPLSRFLLLGVAICSHFWEYL
jgi:hypothetical protein